MRLEIVAAEPRPLRRLWRWLLAWVVLNACAIAPSLYLQHRAEKTLELAHGLWVEAMRVAHACQVDN